MDPDKNNSPNNTLNTSSMQPPYTMPSMNYLQFQQMFNQFLLMQRQLNNPDTINQYNVIQPLQPMPITNMNKGNFINNYPSN